MRYILIFLGVIAYLFSLVFIESELIKIQIRKERLKSRFQELVNQQKDLEFRLTKLSTLAVIEAQAKERGFVFPDKEDILGVIK
jgi:preprotein translocase subunit SecY